MRSVLLLLITANVTVSAYSQTTKPGRIVTTTRLVAIFSQLESNLEKAVQKKDQTAFHQFLSDEFEVWTPAPPGQPIPGEDWWKQAAAKPPQSFRMRQMAVRSLADDISVASFVLSERVNQSTAQTRDTFIVDVWKQSGDKWQLTDRYAAPIAPRRPSAPGTDKRPTGKQ